ncbi:hypothetical protein HLI_03600 [Halobacillus litoralis]|uniref:Uncharacterized protein n=1 Tax=Halobacillus litoralis TaxID=45668 RepID=A0A410M9L0_9BACI|nr:hypothetical protein HLI_03600 [Halobacillus litoralis]
MTDDPFRLFYSLEYNRRLQNKTNTKCLHYDYIYMTKFTHGKRAAIHGSDSFLFLSGIPFGFASTTGFRGLTSRLVFFITISHLDPPLMSEVFHCMHERKNRPCGFPASLRIFLKGKKGLNTLFRFNRRHAIISEDCQNLCKFDRKGGRDHD